jgi:mannosyltransferase OCH1-like enzyme
MIPAIIHQIWWQGEQNIPAKYTNYRQSYRDYHKDWKIICWDAPAIRNLIATHYPAYYELFEAYPEMIQKIDVGKYFILDHLGGFYVDMDTKCEKSLEPLRKYDLILSEMELHCDKDATNCNMIRVMTMNEYSSRPFLNNGFIGCVPHHPVWTKSLFPRLAAHQKRRWFMFHNAYIFHSTGPTILTLAVRDGKYEKGKNVLVAEPIYFDPCSYYYYKCIKSPKTYVTHRYAGSWHSAMTNIMIQMGLHSTLYTASSIALLMIILMLLLFSQNGPFNINRRS